MPPGVAPQASLVEEAALLVGLDDDGGVRKGDIGWEEDGAAEVPDVLGIEAAVADRVERVMWISLSNAASRILR